MPKRKNIIEKFLERAASTSGRERVLLTIFLIIPFGFIMMAIYLGYLIIRDKTEEHHRKVI